MVLSYVVNTYVDGFPELRILLILSVDKSMVCDLFESKAGLLCFNPFTRGTPLGGWQYRPIFEQQNFKICKS